MNVTSVYFMQECAEIHAGTFSLKNGWTVITAKKKKTSNVGTSLGDKKISIGGLTSTTTQGLIG